jgi:RTX calcium-binding nonapeptide repeat (4 copies)
MKRATKVVAAAVLLLTLSAANAAAQGLPIIFCAEQEPETPRCVGTDQAESLVGQDTMDVIRAFAGGDIVNAEDGDDDAFGGSGVDNMTGGFGDDELSGGKGTDTLNDGLTQTGELTKGDTDELRGNGGDDILRAEDNDFRDTIQCGGGDEDAAFFDENPQTGRSDAVSDDCEFRNEPPPGP